MKILETVFFRIHFLAILCGMFLLVSCKDDLPGGVDSSDKFTELKSIKIINSGQNGDLVVEGIIDESKKTISFPRLDTLSDFSNIKFEAELSDGATLDKETYEVSFDGGKAENAIVIKVLNAPRYREYLATLRLKVPVYGADFKEGIFYDYSNNPLGNPLYPHYAALDTRGAAFDGDYVMVPSRLGSVNPHLLKVSDLKQGIINKLNLNTTNIGGGTLAIQTGEFVNGNLYVFNVSSTGGGFKIYFYEDYKTNYNKPPKVITVPVNDLPAVPNSGRFGENTSVSLDENGNGFIFMPDNPTKNILRLKIANYTQVVNRSILPLPNTSMTFGMSYNSVGNTGKYLCTSYNAPIYVVNEGATVSTTVPATSFELSAADARVVNFNNERYLIYMTAGVNSPSVTVFKVYNITRGKTVDEALEYFGAQTDLEKKAIFEFSLNGGANSAPITYTSWKVEKDNKGKDSKLLLFTSATSAGFSIFEFPVNVAKD